MVDNTYSLVFIFNTDFHGKQITPKNYLHSLTQNSQKRRSIKGFSNSPHSDNNKLLGSDIKGVRVC